MFISKHQVSGSRYQLKVSDVGLNSLLATRSSLPDYHRGTR